MRRELALLVAGLTVGAAVEALTFRALCVAEAWLAAADIDHEWWSRMRHLEESDS